MQVITVKKNLKLIDISGIDTIILKPNEFTAGGQRKQNNKTEEKRPQDFMQTLIPQIGSNLVLRLPLL